jgi:hypothetical protein
MGGWGVGVEWGVRGGEGEGREREERDREGEGEGGE